MTTQPTPRKTSSSRGEQPNATRPAEVTQEQLICDRCSHKTDGGAWVGFAYVGNECLTEEEQEYIECK